MISSPKIPVEDVKKPDAFASTPGMHRRASAMTRYANGTMQVQLTTRSNFGHFMAEKQPRATWVTSIMKLEGDPGGNVVRDTLWERMAKMPRFRSRLVVNRWGGYWEELPESKLVELRDNGYLWSEVFPMGGATDADIEKVVGETNDWQYNRDYPLWRVQFCRKMHDGSACVVCTINHGIGDGVSLVAVLLNMCDPEPSDGGAAGDKKDRRPTAAGKRAQGPKLGPVTRVGTFTHGVYQGLTAVNWKPDAGNILCLKDVTKPSAVKLVAQTAQIPLDEFKAIKMRFPGATLNDVMMALMTATVKAFYEEKGDPCVKNGATIRGAFPINLRKPGKDPLRQHVDGQVDPANIWTYGLFKFDFQYKSYVDLVWRVKRQVDKIKISPAPLIQYRLVSIITKALPRKVLLDQLLNAANLTSGQLSNVPGPQTRVHIAGVPVTSLQFNLFTPVGFYFGILSYDGVVSASVNLDSSLGIDPKDLAKHWKSEFEKMKEEINHLPPGPVKPPVYWL